MWKEKITNPDPPKFRYIFGRPLAPLYGGLMAARSTLYKRDFFKRHKVAAPVISVGNLTLGGTGKTPMVIYLARLFADKKVVIVSRGYRGKARDKVNVVADGQQIFLDARQAGDEPNLMASLLPGVPVLTGSKRIFPARYGVEHFGGDLVLLDDGFQHMSLQRDVDIVLFKVDTFMGNNRVFPGGDMREPLAALGRAHCFVLTCVDAENQKKADAITQALEQRFPGTPVFQASYEPVGLVPLQGEAVPLGSFRCGAFCGLGAPRHFAKSLQQAGFDVVSFKGFADHHHYTAKELTRFVRKSRKAGATALVTTEKDLVKLQGINVDLPLYALRMEMIMAPNFADFLRQRLAAVA